MALVTTVFAAFRRLGIVVGILIAFVIGLTGTVYLSLRTREVTVPDVVGKHYLEGESALENAKLNIRKRAKRFKGDAKPDTILDQSPRSGEVVKVGQTVAVIVSDEQSGKEAGVNAPAAVSEESKPTDNRATGNENARASNQNENRDRRNKNSNRNANNRNSNNANNQNTGNNSNRTNADNRNVNANRNANTNRGGMNTNANRSGGITNNSNRPNTNARNSNVNANTNRSTGANSNRNTNAGRTNGNSSPRPRPTP